MTLDTVLKKKSNSKKWMLPYGPLEKDKSFPNVWLGHGLVNEEDWYTDGVNILIHPKAGNKEILKS